MTSWPTAVRGRSGFQTYSAKGSTGLDLRIARGMPANINRPPGVGRLSLEEIIRRMRSQKGAFAIRNLSLGIATIPTAIAVATIAYEYQQYIQRQNAMAQMPSRQAVLQGDWETLSDCGTPINFWLNGNAHVGCVDIAFSAYPLATEPIAQYIAGQTYIHAEHFEGNFVGLAKSTRAIRHRNPNIIAEPISYENVFALQHWVPVPVPYTLPGPLPWPLPPGVEWPVELPGEAVEPISRPVPVPRPPPVTGIIIIVPPAGAAGGGVTPGPPHKWRPPDKRVRERKHSLRNKQIPMADSFFRALARKVSVVSEGLDMLDAAYYALPRRYQARRSPFRRLTPQMQIRRLWWFWRQVNMPMFIRNVVMNEIQDQFLGTLGQGANRLRRQFRLREYLYFGPYV